MMIAAVRSPIWFWRAVRAKRPEPAEPDFDDLTYGCADECGAWGEKVDGMLRFCGNWPWLCPHRHLVTDPAKHGDIQITEEDSCERP